MSELSIAPRVVPTPTATSLALSADGRHVALVDGDELILDGRSVLRAPGLVAAGAVDGAMWVISERGGAHELHRVDVARAEVAPPVALGELGRGVRITTARTGARTALVEGASAVVIREVSGELAIETIPGDGYDRHVLCDARGVVERRGAILASRTGVAGFTLPPDLKAGVVVGGASVFDTAALMVVVEQRARRTVVVADLRSHVVRHRIRIGEANVVAVAERRGLLVLGRDAHVALVDLRHGRCVGERILSAPLAAAAIDRDGARLIVVDVEGRALELGASLHDASRETEVVESAEEAEVEVAPPPTPVVDEPPAPANVADAPLLALQTPASGIRLSEEQLEEYLRDVRALVVAYATTASGRSDGNAESTARERFRTWHRPGAPHVELASELGLSNTAVSVLWLAAAPYVWGELARAYTEIKPDPTRPLVDELVIAQLIEATATTRAQLARELDDDAPLRRHGVIEIAAGARPFAALTVHPAVIRRLIGETFDAPVATPSLASLRAPKGEIEGAIAALAQPWRGPVRVVVRGPLGSGRRTIATALAARAGRRLGCVELAPPAPGASREAELRRALRDVAVRGAIPCVTLEHLGDDSHELQRLQGVIDGHPGPLFIRSTPAGALPVGPDHHAVTLHVLDETARAAAWRETLAARGLSTDAADGLAARYAIGPGLMSRAVDRVRSDDPSGTERAVAAALRRYRGAMIADVATRVERLPSLNDLVLPAELSTSLRALIGRVRSRRTVLETWRMDRIASTARGVTALFQGGPGTGKTMAAGVVARELGWELWRVDLSRVMSRWLGETEKNLARVFDAAEGGEIVLLFDEADSLFGKRTDVKSSHDRYANLEVNYLLQRLDDFSGIAILTTNFGATIDSAVRRRLSGELQFPFPDETERERLWRAHLPSTVPGAADLELADVARRYQLAGGYIRNAALRACFLAADEGTSLTVAHVEAAVLAEYHDRARVSVGGRLD